MSAPDARDGLPTLASVEDLRTTLDAMGEGLVVQEESGAIVFWNPSTERILGLTAAQISGRTSLDPRWRSVHGNGTPFPGEDRIMVPSPKVATYDLQPEMSAPELAEKAVAAIRAGRHDLIVLNFANPDMVGHTGSLPAAIRACETVDAALARIAAAITEAGGCLLVTADHGNAELMRDPATGGPHTAHTTNPVPVLLHEAPAGTALAEGRLADIAPTLLALLGLPQPAAMTGRSLLRTGEGAGAPG